MDSKSLRTAEWSTFRAAPLPEAEIVSAAETTVPAGSFAAAFEAATDGGFAAYEPTVNVAAEVGTPADTYQSVAHEAGIGRFSAFKQSLGERLTRIRESWNTRKTIATTVAALGAFSLAGCGAHAAASHSGASKPNAVLTAANNNCGDLQLTDVTPKGYADGAFLPEGSFNAQSKTSLADQAAARVQSWFGKKGPLAGPNTVRGSLAMEYAAIAEPAQKGTINNSFNYVNAFEQAYNRLSGPNAKAQAVQDCKDVTQVMGETESYVDNAPGTQFTELKAVYAKDGSIDDVQLAHVSSIPTGLVEFSVPKKDNDLHSISPVYVDQQGLQYIAGYLPLSENQTSQTGTTGNQQTKTGNSGTNPNQTAQSGTQPNQQGTAGTTTATQGPAGTTTPQGPAGSSGGQAGGTPTGEAPNGTNNGTSPSKTLGSQPESTTGPEQSPAPGAPSGGVTTGGPTGEQQPTSPSTPSVPSTPSTPSTPETPPTTPPPTTPPPTTPPPTTPPPTTPPPTTPPPTTPPPTTPPPSPEKAPDPNTNTNTTLPGTGSTGDPFNAGGSSDASGLAE